MVILTYNSSDTIDKVIQSAFLQTLSPNEIIVVDDASTDDTIQNFINTSNSDDQCIRYYRLEINSGPSIARNLGVSKANPF